MVWATELDVLPMPLDVGAEIQAPPQGRLLVNKTSDDVGALNVGALDVAALNVGALNLPPALFRRLA
jgi:hypothetical protein